MSRHDKQAFPRHEKHFDGLTLREWLVGQALSSSDLSYYADPAEHGRRAVTAADAALAAMQEKPL